MQRRFPLYAKILAWFFLNLVLLGVVFLALFRTQFPLGLDWFVSGTMNERLEPIAQLIVEELDQRPAAQWNAALQRYQGAYALEFYLFGNDGEQLAGAPVTLPANVRNRLLEFRPGPGLGPPGAGLRGPQPWRDLEPVTPNPDPLPPRFRGGPGLERGPGLGPRWLRPAGPFPKVMVRTADPTQYWMLVRVALPDGERSRPRPVTLVAVADSLAAGGWLFDVRPWLAGAAGVLVLSALFWFPLIRSITRNLGQMTHATRQIAEGRFEVRVPETRRDELGLLGQSINQMAGRLEGFVAGQKRFLGDIAHELCSPLARLRVALGILEQRADAPHQTYVNAAADKAEQMAHLVNELLSFSKASLGSAPIALEAVRLRDLAEKARQREATDACTIQNEVPETLTARGEPELLMRALANLLRNAVRHAGHAGPILIRGQREREEVELVVTDSGPGIPEPELARVFDPFYRVDASRDRETGGAGLGLAIVKTCVESCGGTVACRNRQPSGLEVVIRLRAAGD